MGIKRAAQLNEVILIWRLPFRIKGETVLSLSCLSLSISLSLGHFSPLPASSPVFLLPTPYFPTHVSLSFPINQIHTAQRSVRAEKGRQSYQALAPVLKMAPRLPGEFLACIKGCGRTQQNRPLRFRTLSVWADCSVVMYLSGSSGRTTDLQRWDTLSVVAQKGSEENMQA